MIETKRANRATMCQSFTLSPTSGTAGWQLNLSRSLLPVPGVKILIPGEWTWSPSELLVMDMMERLPSILG